MRTVRKARPARLLVAAVAAAAAGAGIVALRLPDGADPVPPSRAVPAPVAQRPARVPVAAPVAMPAPAPNADARAAAAPAPPRPGRQILLIDEKPRAGTLGEIARAILAEHRDELGLAAMPGDLIVKREFESLSGWHLRYEQAIGGVPVFGSEVSAHVAKDGRPLLVAADVFPVEGAETAPVLTSADARSAAAAIVGDDASAVESKEPRLVIVPVGRKGVLAWRVDVHTDEESARVLIDAKTGRPVGVDDLRHAADGAAAVFVPNPIYSQKDGSLRDNNNADSTALTAARKPVTLRRLDGSGYLRGTWADITWTRRPTMSASLDWSSVTRSNPAFEQVMAYYHIDTLQQRLQDMGVTGVNARSMPADAHAFSQDNSYYDSFDKALHFGDGGVDDAEDADVIHHEYGHAMQDDQVPDFGLSAEAGAIGEGFGDFQAVSFHTDGNPAYDPLFASWDGVPFSSAVPPYLRRVDGSKVYPRDVVGEVHADGEIWSRFLWDLRGLVGNDESLKLVVESDFLLSPSARFRDAANAILATDVSLRAGADVTGIRALLDARGLPYDTSAPPPPVADDSYEPNDDAAHAVPLAAGFTSGLVLADADWYQLTVPPNRRLHVTPAYDATRVLVGEEIRTTGGTLLDSETWRGGAVDASAGPDGATVLLRVTDADGNYAGAGYSLAIADTELVALRPGHTRLVGLADGGYAVFQVAVRPASVRRGDTLRVAVKQHWGGALAAVRLVSPTGRIAVGFGDRRTDAGASVSAVVDEAGAWVVEIRPREGTSGTCVVKARVQ
jgi:hypothetical protein